jgi:hypothetical protein
MKGLGASAANYLSNGVRAPDGGLSLIHVGTHGGELKPARVTVSFVGKSGCLIPNRDDPAKAGASPSLFEQANCQQGVAIWLTCKGSQAIQFTRFMSRFMSRRAAANE